MNSSGLSGTFGWIRNYDLIPCRVPPCSEFRPTRRSCPIQGRNPTRVVRRASASSRMEQVNRGRETVSRCFKCSTRPAQRPACGTRGGDCAVRRAPSSSRMKQVNRVGKIVSRCFKRSIRPAQRPACGTGSGDGAARHASAAPSSVSRPRRTRAAAWISTSGPAPGRWAFSLMWRRHARAPGRP